MLPCFTTNVYTLKAIHPVHNTLNDSDCLQNRGGGMIGLWCISVLHKMSTTVRDAICLLARPLVYQIVHPHGL